MLTQQTPIEAITLGGTLRMQTRLKLVEVLPAMDGIVLP